MSTLSEKGADSRTSRPCFDAGTEYCPCVLGFSGDCVACSILRGQNRCDCGWSSLCIYDHFLRSGKLAPQPRGSIHTLPTEISPIVGSRVPAYILKLDVPQPLARLSIFPGSFIMVRPKDAAERFNVPLSIIEAGEHSVVVAIEVVGPKTKSIQRSLDSGMELAVTGPFWSGLQGINLLRKYASGRILAVAKGMGQAGVIQVARYVISRGGYFKALLGPGTLGTVFADEILTKTGAEVEILPREEDHNLSRILTEMTNGDYDLVVSGNSDLQHRAIAAALQELTVQGGKAIAKKSPAPTGIWGPTAVRVPQMVWLSNLTMVCADGVCGACLRDGFRGCKASIPVESAFSLK